MVVSLWGHSMAEHPESMLFWHHMHLLRFDLYLSYILMRESTDANYHLRICIRY